MIEVVVLCKIVKKRYFWQQTNEVVREIHADFEKHCKKAVSVFCRNQQCGFCSLSWKKSPKNTKKCTFWPTLVLESSRICTQILKKHKKNSKKQHKKSSNILNNAQNKVWALAFAFKTWKKKRKKTFF